MSNEAHIDNLSELNCASAAKKVSSYTKYEPPPCSAHLWHCTGFPIDGKSKMPIPSTKRQKREEYRQAQAQAHIQHDNGGDIKLPKKRFYRQRAHANPFSDHRLVYPISPAHMDWSSHYPAYVDPDPSQENLGGARKLTKAVEVVDIGCGFGGLLVGLAPVLPDTLMVGMEIRPSVLEYVTTRVQALRAQQNRLRSQSSPSAIPAVPVPVEEVSTPPLLEEEQPTASPPSRPGSSAGSSSLAATTTLVPGGYENISAIRANTMKFLPNFFARHQLSKIFICFPDPHFKARKHKARIVSETLNAEYAYVLRPGGLLYTITDVEEYHHWILKHFHQIPDAPCKQNGEETQTQEALGDSMPDLPPGSSGIKDLWERVPDEELRLDECVRIMQAATEESKKVTRNKGNKYVAVFRRRPDPEWPPA